MVHLTAKILAGHLGLGNTLRLPFAALLVVPARDGSEHIHESVVDRAEHPRIKFVLAGSDSGGKVSLHAVFASTGKGEAASDGLCSLTGSIQIRAHRAFDHRPFINRASRQVFERHAPWHEV